MHNTDLVIASLLRRYPLVSDQVDTQELRIIMSELFSSEPLLVGSSAVVEFGCYIGTTSLFIRRTLDALAVQATFHVYDSFEGLPDKTGFDASPVGEQFVPGALSVSKREFEMQFKKANLKLPRIHKAWFSNLTQTDMPENISFAYLDGDYYESIRDSLALIAPKLLPGATIVVDDYANEALPGAAKAVDEWLRFRDASFRVQSSLAVIKL